MKTTAALVAVILIGLIVIQTAACTKSSITGNAVEETGSDFQRVGKNQQDSNSNINSGGGEEKDEGCVVDAGTLNRIFSGHGSL